MPTGKTYSNDLKGLSEWCTDNNKEAPEYSNNPNSMSVETKRVKVGNIKKVGMTDGDAALKMIQALGVPVRAEEKK